MQGRVGISAQAGARDSGDRAPKEELARLRASHQERPGTASGHARPAENHTVSAWARFAFGVSIKGDLFQKLHWTRGGDAAAIP